MQLPEPAMLRRYRANDSEWLRESKPGSVLLSGDHTCDRVDTEYV
jgi:hypothetical protein